MLSDINTKLNGIATDLSETKTSLKDAITRSAADIQKDIAHIRGHIITKLMVENSDLRTRVSYLERRFLSLEKTTNKIEQNHRKSNLEFSGIPRDVNDDQLKQTVADIINDITEENITTKDIEACHRLQTKQNPKPTIIRANRSLLEKVRKNRKSLRGIGDRLKFPPHTKIFVNDNLSSNMKSIDYNARKLAKDGAIQYTWFSNAAVRLKCLDGSTIIATHEADLYENFPAYQHFSFDTSMYDRILNADMEEVEEHTRMDMFNTDVLETVTVIDS